MGNPQDILQITSTWEILMTYCRLFQHGKSSRHTADYINIGKPHDILQIKSTWEILTYATADYINMGKPHDILHITSTWENLMTYCTLHQHGKSS